MGVYVKAASKLGKTVGSHIGTGIGTKIGRVFGAKKIGGEVGGRVFGRIGKNIARSAARNTPILGSLKRGGKIHKTGLYRLHRGEYVINAKSAKNFKKKYSKH